MTLQPPEKLMPWFLMGSVALLALMLVVWAQDIRRPWKPYQRAFIQSERDAAESPAEQKSVENFRMGIRQIEVPALGRVDRCTTCHLAVNHPDYADAPHPLRSHPNAGHHSFEEFGCTVCHRGNGLATTADAAHGRTPDSAYPMLPTPFVTSSCLACHDLNSLPGVERLKTGRRLFETNGCLACHSAAHLMVIFCILHMVRVFCTGAYRKPREFNWVLGVVLLGLTLGLSFTGYLLPWDQLSFWAITVSANILDYVPILGAPLRRLLLGGEEVGQAALLRFYVLHVFALPTVAFLLIAVHVWRVRKDGGLACSDPKLRGKDDLGATTHVLAWPHLLLRLLLVLQGTLILVIIPSLLWDAPLLEIANPAHPPNPSKAPWYFLGLQEMVAHSAFWGGFLIPTVLAVLLLILPYVDSNPKGSGRWFSRDRRFVLGVFAFCLLTLALLTVIGFWFRGPNWAWQWPWGGLGG